MIGRTAGARQGFRWGIFVLAFVIAFTAFAGDEADARGRKKRHGGAGRGYTPPYAAIVVDVNAGKVLHAANPDSIRHPASLTKIMTLYLLFEQIEAGKFRLDTPLPVSAHAASQAPSKLGVRPGQTIEVEDAIKALVTKSANDVAVVIAEAIGGDEDDFASMMTRKARAIGMSRTVYANASGLPNSEQVTTARDQATLGRAVQERFPRLYRYFSTASFHYRGRVIGNHNRLLGRVPGVDGIKTGYVRASGFNLVSSMRRNDRHLVAVVLGGPSGRWRDSRMHQLLEGHVEEASVRRTVPKLVEVADTSAPPAPTSRSAALEPADPRLPTRAVAVEPAPKPASVVRIEPARASVIEAGSAEPIKPILVRTMTVKRSVAETNSVASLPSRGEPAPQYALAGQGSRSIPPPTSVGTVPSRQVAAAGDAIAPMPSEAKPLVRATRGEWIIQIGAFPAETQAHDRLKAAQNLARTMLSAAEPFTERVAKPDGALYRARFAGFDRDHAEAACKYLKRNEIDCLALKN